MKLNNIIIILLFSMISTKAESADWKYMGRGDGPNKESATYFYDAQSLYRSDEDLVKVRVQAISDKEMDRQFKNNENNISASVQKKYANLYIPPYLSANKRKYSPEEHFNIITAEEIAAVFDTKPVLKMFQEINCKSNQFRTLSVMSYQKGGRITSDDKPQKWEHIISETLVDGLKHIVCSYKGSLR
jgi:hypothetical protein